MGESGIGRGVMLCVPASQHNIIHRAPCGPVCVHWLPHPQEKQRALGKQLLRAARDVGGSRSLGLGCFCACQAVCVKNKVREDSGERGEGGLERARR